MIEPSRPPGVVGQFYEVCTDRTGTVTLDLARRVLPSLTVRDGVISGDEVMVSCRGVIVADGDAGAGLVGVPLEPVVLGADGLCFEPAEGGVRTRENRLARGAYNDAVTEASRFGMVNAFVHSTRAACYVNSLLVELGEAPLPLLPVVVSAHPGSRLPGFGSGDGDFRSGRMRPLSGGHYRVSQRTTGVPEPVAVCPSGEVHLGPGRLRQRFAGSDSYLRAASHNPATVYHEYGHHLCRHTADFRLNAERKPAEQRNGKPGVEEGVCDYLAASLLGTGRPYGWYRSTRGERRDPDRWGDRPDDDVGADADDNYAVGARWAARWWRCRQRLVDAGRFSPRDHDRVIVATLLTLGQMGSAGPGGRGRTARQEARCCPGSVVDAYLDAVRRQGGGDAVDVVGDLVGPMLLPEAAPGTREAVC